MNKQVKTRDDGVSPVVGVMLMLVVTIIIAAVVSGFSGGLMGGSSQKAPTLTMDIKIANTGTWSGSGFTATVTGASEPIPTSTIKLVTSWRATNRTTGESIIGGNTSFSTGSSVTTYSGSGGSTIYGTTSTAPYGFGNGITGPQNMVPPYAPGQNFGNFTLTQGTSLIAIPFGGTTNADAWGTSATEGYGIATPYEYSDGNGGDPAVAVLGGQWPNLKVGDIVTVNVIHIPTGKVIMTKDVSVSG